MRGVVLASLLLLFALAGCMGMQPSDDDWDAYDSGRGLAFGMALTILLIVGVVILVVNLTSSPRSPETPATPPPPAVPPSTPPLGGGWETVQSSAPARKPTSTAKRSTKAGKPRRPAP